MSEASFLQLPFAIRTTLNFGGYMMQFPILFSAVLSIFLAVFQEMAFGANQIGL